MKYVIRKNKFLLIAELFAVCFFFISSIYSLLTNLLFEHNFDFYIIFISIFWLIISILLFIDSIKNKIIITSNEIFICKLFTKKHILLNEVIDVKLDAVKSHNQIVFYGNNNIVLDKLIILFGYDPFEVYNLLNCVIKGKEKIAEIYTSEKKELHRAVFILIAKYLYMVIISLLSSFGVIVFVVNKMLNLIKINKLVVVCLFVLIFVLNLILLNKLLIGSKVLSQKYKS